MSILPVVDGLVIGPGFAKKIVNGTAEAEYIPGWRPTFVYTGLKPIFILCLSHVNGDDAHWFLDEEMRRVGGHSDDLPLLMRYDLAASCCRLFSTLWNEFLLQPKFSSELTKYFEFFNLPQSTRDELLSFFLEVAPKPVKFEDLECLESNLIGSKLIELGHHQILIRSSHLKEIFHPHRIQDQNVEFLIKGSFKCPSPVDGHDVEVVDAVYYDLNCIAYYFYDSVNSFTFFLICSEIYFRQICLYIPEGAIAFTPKPEELRTRLPDLAHALHRHIVRYGKDIQTGRTHLAHSPIHIWYGMTALHVGHILWNDITGIERIVLSVPRHRFPKFYLFDSHLQPEMYGPLDQIFPELVGHVFRDPGTFLAAIPTLYRQRCFPLRQTSMVVTRNIRDRIMNIIDLSPQYSQELSRSRAITCRDTPIILLGLRTENRTLPELKEFCVALVGHLASTVGVATLVVDGHNSRPESPDQLIWSHEEVRAAKPPILIEHEIVRAMSEASVGTSIGVISTIGKPIAHSLIWCRASKFFVALWGAGLAKYRWVCNKPGLIITNEYNITSIGITNTMTIYSDPQFMEDPTLVKFIDKAAVTDLPGAPLLVDHGNNDPTLTNFNLDWSVAFRDVDRFI